MAIAIAVAILVPGFARASTLPASRPQAEAYLGFPESSELDMAADWALFPAFPNLSFNDPVFLIPEPASDRLWVCEREGRILSFTNDDTTTALQTVLDLRAVTQGDGDSGLLSMAFHPRFAMPGDDAEGFFYVGYAHRDPPPPDDPDALQPLEFRVSRFTVQPGTAIADPKSELVLIRQLDDHVWHQGGAMFFHPDDGFLYITTGDEGGGRCRLGNCQRIDTDLFAGVLRIDVDQLGPPISHPIVRQPQTGTTAHYFIPDDNPFVGDADVLEEFYALGLRSPHRMTHDPVDGYTWIGDVGQSAREELDILQAGANFQWNILEGTQGFGDEPVLPDPLIGIWTDPVLDYGRSTGGTVIGGYVYRGNKFPELQGQYIYGDFISGRLWALSYTPDGDTVRIFENRELVQTQLRGREDGFTSLGVDAEGEIFVLHLGEETTLKRLARNTPDAGGIPTTLSETGLFENLETLEAIDALIPYEVRSPLWSDGARKQRWMSVPSDTTIGYRNQSSWQFPPGSVFVKHFDMALDRRTPETFTRLETRVLVVEPEGNLYGLTYKWGPEQDDADLLTSPFSEELEFFGEDGSAETHRYDYPGPNDCLSCHNQGADHVLGLKTRQSLDLAVDATGIGQTTQLDWLSEQGFFDEAPSAEELEAVEPLFGLDDDSASAQERIRSYLDANCAHCHGSLELDRSLWDARATTAFENQGILYGLLLGEYGGESDFVVRPLDPLSSILYLRTLTTDANLRMPPLARNQQDQAFVDLLEEWILSLESVTTTTMASTSSTTLVTGDSCGDPAQPFGRTTASDAAYILKAAVGLIRLCPECLCDASGNGVVTASDALRVLSLAVGLPLAADCPSCD